MLYWGVASIWRLYHKGLIGGVLQRWLSFWKVLPSPQRDSRALSDWPSFKLLTFKNDGGHCVLGDLQCCRHLLVPFSRSVPQHNPVSELYGQFLQPHRLILTLTCTVNCGILCHVQSIEFTTGEFQSSCRNISRVINGNRIYLSSTSSLIAKGLNTYANKVFVYFIFNTFFIILFLLCHYRVLCVDWWVKQYI